MAAQSRACKSASLPICRTHASRGFSCPPSGPKTTTPLAGRCCFRGGEGGIRTHVHPLRCNWNSSPAPSTARPPLRWKGREPTRSAAPGKVRVLLRQRDPHRRASPPRPWRAAAADNGVSGKRMPGPTRPRRCTAHLTGIGFASTNSAWCSGIRRSFMRACLVVPARERGGAHLVHGARRDVGGHRNHAARADAHQLRGRRVVAAQQHEIRARLLQDRLAARHVASGLLDAGDARMVRQPHDRVGLHVARRAARHVVEDDRNAHRVGDRREVAIQAFLGGLVVVRRDDQQRVGARRPRRLATGRRSSRCRWCRCRR